MRVAHLRLSRASIRRAMVGALIAMALFSCPVRLSPGDPQSVRVRYEDGTSARELPALVQDGCTYVPLAELVATLGGRVVKSEKANKAVAYVGTRELTVSPFNCFVVIGSRVRQMPVETLLQGGELYVPLPYFVEVLADSSPELVKWDEQRRFLTIASKGAVVLGAVVESKANGMLVRVTCTRRFASSDVYTSLTGNGWLYIDFYGGVVDSSSAYLEDRAKEVREWYASQLSSEVARLALRLRSIPKKREVLFPEGQTEVWISLPTQDTLSTDLIAGLRAAREKWRIDTVVLDPGHGGKDPGAIGPTGLYEKNVVLSTCKELKAMLEDELGLTVYMTRTGDTYPTLKQRTALANRHNGKLFVSVHANAHRRPTVRGFSVYILGPAKTEEALEVARRENEVIKEYESMHNGYGDFGNPNFILAAMAHNEFVRESEELAGLISNGLARWTQRPNLGVEQAGFYVLVGASMPSVLVEIGFISHREEEKVLRDRAEQKRIARGIFEGIKRFKELYEMPVSAEPHRTTTLDAKQR